MKESKNSERVEACTVRGRDEKAGTLRLFITRRITDVAGAIVEERGEFYIAYDEPANADSYPNITVQPDTSKQTPGS